MKVNWEAILRIFVINRVLASKCTAISSFPRQGVPTEGVDVWDKDAPYFAFLAHVYPHFDFTCGKMHENAVRSSSPLSVLVNVEDESLDLTANDSQDKENDVALLSPSQDLVLERLDSIFDTAVLANLQQRSLLTRMGGL
ncbi:hypothetical protein M422DRAFT_34441 [Sphaerobolus stellatus SS14]|uniref:Uncharacterized protein n=1 Tax=Sphaerobolus stellatus (strain SS14) TaxID=990650 RepID=A0A0C9V2W5_SPHS4|nr:hypothetical protein M422DRAFT_34441 [Sphaerobolus stellatus SS14]